MSFLKLIILSFIHILFLHVTLHAQNDPFQVNALFNLDQPETLGLSSLKGSESVTIFSPGKGDPKYNHGVVLFPFKDMLYAQWQSSEKDEDAPDTRVYYSRSANGTDWSKPMILTPQWDGGIKTSGGWWGNGDTLVAYICVWPAKSDLPKQGYTEYMTSTDGLQWSSPRKVQNAEGKPVMGIIEQDVHAFPNGRLITSFHMQPGLRATPFYTDDSLGITGWQAGKMENRPSGKTMSRELEPSWFYRKDGAVVMVFRDQNSTFKKLAAISRDTAVTWTTPIIIDTPDSRAKQSAGNLPDGTAFMVNNPSGNKNRFPLVITLSRDGFIFDKAYLLRGGGDLPPLRHPGKYKRKGFSYPKSVLWGDFLYISYATNKEEVSLTRIPISRLLYR